MTIYPKLILDALATVRYPGTGKNLVEAGMVEDNIRIEGMKVSFSLIFEKPTCLLYTSPSPRDGATSRMPSSA